MEHGYSVIAHSLGIDPAAFSELRHAYDDGVYTGIDISEGFGHYGTPRHSGRYPWGSGDNPYQRNASFLGKVEQLSKAKGPDGKKLFTEKQIAEAMGMNTSELRKRKSLANAENRAYEASEAKRLKEKGMSKGELTSVASSNGGIINMINPEAKDKDAIALLQYITDEDKLEKLLENQHIIKTPVVRNGKQSTLGYQPDVWKKWE
jgi:arsenate reductase-like glutaredoxin family protein